MSDLEEHRRRQKLSREREKRAKKQERRMTLDELEHMAMLRRAKELDEREPEEDGSC